MKAKFHLADSVSGPWLPVKLKSKRAVVNIMRASPPWRGQLVCSENSPEREATGSLSGLLGECHHSAPVLFFSPVSRRSAAAPLPPGHL